MRNPFDMRIVRRLSALTILIAAISSATGARAAEDITNIDPASNTTKQKIQIAGVWYLKVNATFNNGYGGYEASIMDVTDYKSARFQTYQGETACWIMLGPNDTYNSCKVTVTAAKSTVNGLVKVTLGSVNVKVTNP